MVQSKAVSVAKTTPSGSDGERDLIQALESFFFLVGKKYRKDVPDAHLPSVHEFLSYARSISDELYDASRQTIALTKLQHGASRQEMKQIVTGRIVTAYTVKYDTTHIQSFLKYLFHDVEYAYHTPLFMCITTVICSVLLSTHMNLVFRLPYTPIEIAKYMETLLAHPECKLVMGRPLNHFCSHYVPVLHALQKNVLQLAISYLRMHSYIPYLTESFSTPYESLSLSLHASHILDALTSLIHHASYKKHYFTPLMECFTLYGIQIA